MEVNKTLLVIFQEVGQPVEVRLDVQQDTVWLSQRQMAELFETTPENVLMHLKNIFRDGELVEQATAKDFLAVRTEGARQVRRNIVLMRPVHSMIEFKQIIGRGTRLYDGKDSFTLYDFVKAHHHFSDPAWDGDPAEPVERIEGIEATVIEGSTTACTPSELYPPPDPAHEIKANEPEPRPPKIKIRLADGKERKLQFMSATSFWSPDGQPISAAQFMEGLFGVMPEFFRDEDELRRIWSDPDTRIRLLAGLAERGFDGSTLKGMQTCIEAENSDLFDVLAYVGYATDPMARTDRAQAAKTAMANQFSNDKQRAFIDFVLSHYVSEGVEELAPEKLTPLIKLRYGNTVRDAISELGPPETIRALFLRMQRHLYGPSCEPSVSRMSPS